MGQTKSTTERDLKTNQPSPDVPYVPSNIHKASLNKYVLILGGTGSGKSTLLNMLYNNDISIQSMFSPAPVASSADSVTKKARFWVNFKKETCYCDTVGLGDPNLTNEEIVHNLKNVLRTSANGITCIMVVAKWGRLSKEDRANMMVIQGMFEDRWKKQSILVFTHYDQDFRKFDECLKTWIGKDEEVKKILDNFQHIIVSDNSTGRYEETNRPLRQQTLDSINNLIAGWTEPFGVAPRDPLDILKELLEKYFSHFNKGKQQSSEGMAYLRNSSGNEKCPICKQSILADACITECGHDYHLKCIDLALDSIKNCPVCETSVNCIILSTTLLSQLKHVLFSKIPKNSNSVILEEEFSGESFVLL